MNFFLLRLLTLKVMFSQSRSTELFNIGKCNRAIDVALMNIGMKDSFTPLDTNDSLLRFLSLCKKKQFNYFKLNNYQCL